MLESQIDLLSKSLISDVSATKEMYGDTHPAAFRELGSEDLAAMYTAPEEHYAVVFSENNPDPPQSVLKHFVEIYTTRVHLQPLPLFEIASLVGKLNAAPRYLIHSFLALMLEFSSHGFYINKHKEASIYYRRSAEATTQHLAAEGKPITEVIQSLCMLTLRDVSAGDLPRAWMSIGTAARLNSIGNMWQIQPVSTKEHDQDNRCYWSIFMIESIFFSHIPRVLNSNQTYKHPPSVEPPPPIPRDSTEINAPDFDDTGGTRHDVGINTHAGGIIAIWSQVASFLHVIRMGEVQVPWLPESTYSKLNLSLFEYEALLHQKHLMRNLFPFKRSPEDIRAFSQYWNPWLTTHLVLHASLALLNHPFIHLVALRRNRVCEELQSCTESKPKLGKSGKIPETFIGNVAMFVSQGTDKTMVDFPPSMIWELLDPIIQTIGESSDIRDLPSESISRYGFPSKTNVLSQSDIQAFYTGALRSPLDYAESKANEFCKQSTPSEIGEQPGTDRNCKDPYRQPGFLFIPPNVADYRETRWMPFTENFIDAEPPESAAYPPKGEVIFNDTQVPEEFLEGPEVPTSWMKIVVAEHRRRVEALKHVENPTVEDFAAMKDEGGLGWLWGRRLVEFGDSIDRRIANYTCHEFDSHMVFPHLHPIEKYPKGICSIPTFNLTFTAYHSAGGFTYRPDWFWYKQMRMIPFEERWEKLWKPHEEPIQGPNGRPDLILWQNGLWDQRGFQVGGQKHHKDDNTTLTQWNRGMTWEELHFYSARLRKFGDLLNEHFPDTPKMFRALTLHQKTGSKDIMLVQMDRFGRALAEYYGHEIFEWGRTISLLGDWYEDRTHPGEGALSWLWGNMILEYLARAAGAGVQVGGEERYPYFEGWDACHEDLLGWGGR
ncbi:hypothetical protein FLONG3_8798 [Fusarium longipes]|uniref:Transcription factor domain-containing protein n=1 Tax=Fusarium longipes TaxID=694270 RepID=A0A395S3D0_9HYPO|nr:hypothetical protein FLONG3_8798 [Fusarium longipes]